MLEVKLHLTRYLGPYVFLLDIMYLPFFYYVVCFGEKKKQIK